MTLRLTINLRHPPRCHLAFAPSPAGSGLARSSAGSRPRVDWEVGANVRRGPRRPRREARRGGGRASGPDRVVVRPPQSGFRLVRGFRNAAPPASRRGQVQGKTKGVGVHVGADGDVDRAVRKLKRVMINEGIERSMKKGWCS